MNQNFTDDERFLDKGDDLHGSLTRRLLQRAHMIHLRNQLGPVLAHGTECQKGLQQGEKKEGQILDDADVGTSKTATRGSVLMDAGRHFQSGQVLFNGQQCRENRNCFLSNSHTLQERSAPFNLSSITDFKRLNKIGAL
jgi:hypothetical protein